jgi:hypothetical protein
MTPRHTLEDRVNATRMRFIRVELELAETYCNLAAEMIDEDKSQRNTMNAQNALDTAQRFLRLVQMTNRETQSFLAKVADLKSMLRA